MVLRKGEVYKCPAEECGCKIRVISGPASPGTKGSHDNYPRCCCGREMERIELSQSTEQS